MGIDIPFNEASTCFDLIAFIDGNPLSERNLVGIGCLFIGHGNNLDIRIFRRVFNGDFAGDIGDDRVAFRLARLKQFFDTGQTLGNIFCRCDTARMERTHGQLGARFADGLCGDDAY